jgi:hypothetical protein
MKRLVDLMVSLSNHEVVAPRQADLVLRQAQDEVSARPAPDCALWHDVMRALDAKPKGAVK